VVSRASPLEVVALGEADPADGEDAGEDASDDADGTASSTVPPLLHAASSIAAATAASRVLLRTRPV
jgi:hypothetical protein